MKKILSIATLCFLLFFALSLFSPLAFADSHPPSSLIVPGACDPTLPANKAGSCNFSAFEGLIQNFIRFLLYFAIPLAVLIIAYGGLLILTSAGNSDRVNKGKHIITGVLVALIIAFLSFTIVQVVFNTLGARQDIQNQSGV